MALSLIASTKGVALIPEYAKSFLPWAITARPLAGKPVAIDLVVGYSRTNTSPFLALFLSRLDQLQKKSDGDPKG